MYTTSPLVDRVNSAKPWYAQIWPWLLMLGPFLVVIAATYTGWIAFTRQDAMVVDDYYKQGNAINQDLRRDAAATNLGLSLNFQYDTAAGKMVGRLSSFGNPLPGAIRINLVHATQPEKDVHLFAKLDSRGEFEVALPVLDKARWQVSVENENREWRLNGVWKWPLQQMVNIKADIPPAD